jgi:hypothetical protein
MEHGLDPSNRYHDSCSADEHVLNSRYRDRQTTLALYPYYLLLAKETLDACILF